MQKEVKKVIGLAKKVFKKEQKIIRYLFLIFVFALVVRFLYFPNDIYFAYDQARDAFVSLKIFSGDLKIVGPPATFRGVNHGALFYYLFGPFYYLFNSSPVGVAILVRVINALGVFVVFFGYLSFIQE